jgi:GT2 family glycosyltransferase
MYKAAVLCYNQPKLTRAMYEQLGDAMVLVDNGSTIDQPALTCDYIRLADNQFFAGGWNQAMTFLEEYEWVWMLNSDVQGVSLKMMQGLVDEAVHVGAGIITPAFNSPHAHMHPQGKGTRFVNWIDWCCPVVNMETWRMVGEFDYPLLKGYGADIDWCKRAGRLGVRMSVSDNYVIHHLGSTTALAEGLQGIQGNLADMDAALNKKYGVHSWTEMF